MKTYAKGVRSERELIHFLSSNGFSCLRSASSGGRLSPVDVVALKQGRIFAFEIKAWANKPKLEHRQMRQFKGWCETAGAVGFVGWYNKNTWKFLPIKDADENKYEDENWLTHKSLLSIIGL